MNKKLVPSKWEGEQKAIKAIQMAFDLDAKMQYTIRREALDLDINPSERIRQILGLESNSSPQRPRLSISLKPEDFEQLGKKYGLESTDKRGIKQQATAELQHYAEKNQPK